MKTVGGAMDGQHGHINYWVQVVEGQGLTGVVEVVDVQRLDLIDRWKLFGGDRPSAHSGRGEVCWLAAGIVVVDVGAAIPILLRRHCAGVVGWHDSSRLVRQSDLELSPTDSVHVNRDDNDVMQWNVEACVQQLDFGKVGEGVLRKMFRMRIVEVQGAWKALGQVRRDEPSRDR